MELTTLYQSASGPAYDSCFFLGLRFDADVGYRPRESEWWVLAAATPKPADDPELSLQYGTARWLTALWRSPAGVAYVGDAGGSIHVNPALTADDSHRKWTVEKLRAPIFGVWGLDDRCVYAWGRTAEEDSLVYRWDGRRWKELPTPGFDVLAIHGTEPDFVYAVGAGGGIALWNGRAWRRAACPIGENLVSVFVASEDEQYATGHRGSLLEGSASGWVKIGQGPSADWPLHAVAKWGGALWLAGGPFGLLRRVKRTSKLEPVKPKLRATAFDARDSLVITCDDRIAGTSNGKDFASTALDYLRDARGSRGLLDFK